MDRPEFGRTKNFMLCFEQETRLSPHTRGKQQQILPGQFDQPPPASLEAVLEDVVRAEQQNTRVRGACVLVAADFNVQAEQVSRCLNIAGCYDCVSENNMDLVDAICQAHTNYKQNAGENMDSNRITAVALTQHGRR